MNLSLFSKIRNLGTSVYYAYGSQNELVERVTR